jgi:hypothetical protein
MFDNIPQNRWQCVKKIEFKCFPIRVSFSPAVGHKRCIVGKAHLSLLGKEKSDNFYTLIEVTPSSHAIRSSFQDYLNTASKDVKR